MSGPFSIEAFAIASANGMIADSHQLMPNALKFDADQRLFADALDKADILVHGRKSHEQQGNSASRKRLVLTRSVPAFAVDKEWPNAWLWNPAGMSLEEACAQVGVRGGLVHVIGGTFGYDYFLGRYSEFHLSRAGQIVIPNGTPVLSGVGEGRSPEDVLSASGLTLKSNKVLDPAHDLTYAIWTPA
jgi:hypothetical protein